jgi:hypothetical protein
MKDWFGRHFLEKPSVQFTLFRREHYPRHYSGTRAVLCRENGERTTGTVGTTPRNTAAERQTLAFTTDTGHTFLLPKKHLSITNAADILIIEIDETAMREHCTLHGLWESSHFPEIR